MIQEITIRKNQMPVMMKSGLVHWVTLQTSERIQKQLQTQSGHTFMTISELSITINTAEIEGVYTLEQYESLINTKQGRYQCAYQKWHEKKALCECGKEIMAKRHAEAQKKEMQYHNRTPEEQAIVSDTLRSIGDELRRQGVLPEKQKIIAKK